MSTLKRIKEFIDYKGINVRQFEINIGVSNGSFASQLKNNKTIGVDKLENILHIYDEINPEWLLTGRGEMSKDKNSVSRSVAGNGNAIVASNVGGNGNTIQHSVSPETINYQEIIKKQQEQIDKLIDIINKLSDK